MLEKKKTLVKLTLFLVLASSCNKEIPKCEKCKVWATDHVTRTIQRKQDKLIVDTGSPEFDNFICMRDEALVAFVSTYINGCLQWPKSIETTTIKKELGKKK